MVYISLGKMGLELEFEGPPITHGSEPSCRGFMEAQEKQGSAVTIGVSHSPVDCTGL